MFYSSVSLPRVQPLKTGVGYGMIVFRINKGRTAMRISTKGLYAIRMLLDLAEHQNCGNIALKDIADRQQISKKYLEQIIPVLNNAGVLRTVRGSLGGYQLAGTPDKYTVGDILR